MLKVTQVNFHLGNLCIIVHGTIYPHILNPMCSMAPIGCKGVITVRLMVMRIKVYPHYKAAMVNFHH
jgi:hypothetical protein